MEGIGIWGNGAELLYLHEKVMIMLMKTIYCWIVSLVCLLLVTACGGDEPSLYQDQTLLCRDVYTIPGDKTKGWSSSNSNIASVKGNAVYACKVGQAKISSRRGSFVVTVTSDNPYKEPCLKWGCGRIR